MKTTIILDHLDLADVRPTGLAQSYDEVRRSEAFGLLHDANINWHGRPSPTDKSTPVPAYVVDGLSFHHSVECGSIFASPTPSQAALDELSRNGESAQLRRAYFARADAADQRRAIHNPILSWLEEISAEQALQLDHIGYFGDDDTGLLAAICDMMAPDGVSTVDQVTAQPSAKHVKHLRAEEIKAPLFDFAIDIGSLERRSDPMERIAAWARALKPGGLIALTTRSASSLEFRVLGPESPSFIALDRLTLFSIPALQSVLEQHGFEILELSTPGRIDVEVLRQVIAEKSNPGGVDFWQHALEHGSNLLDHDLQIMLQRHRLSSFVRCLARKKT